MTLHIPFFSSNWYEPMAEWLRLVADSLETWARVLQCAESFCSTAAILRGTTALSIMFFVLEFVSGDLALTGCPVFSKIPLLLPTSQIYSTFGAIWDIFCFYIAIYHIKQVTSYDVLVWWAEVPRTLIFKHRPEPGRASTLVKNIFPTMYILATKLAQHLLNHLHVIAMFAFTQLHTIWATFMLPLSSHCTHSGAPGQHFVILTQQWRCTYATAPGKRYGKEAEGPTRWSNSEGQHWDLRQLPWLMLHCVHAEGCSPTGWRAGQEWGLGLGWAGGRGGGGMCVPT